MDSESSVLNSESDNNYSEIDGDTTGQEHAGSMIESITLDDDGDEDSKMDTDGDGETRNMRDASSNEDSNTMQSTCSENNGSSKDGDGKFMTSGTSDGASSTGGTTAQQAEQAAQAKSRNRFSRDKALFDEMKFMADFDPTSSNRNREKKRKRYTDGRPQVHAENYDNCDCLIEGCPGCHYPCKRCGDTRCGHECRQGRKWIYESVEVEGRGIVYRNPHARH